MTSVRKPAAAEDDLIGIWRRIAADSPFHADRFLDLLDDKLGLLAETPGMGRLRPELGPSLRAFPVDNYLIVYRASDDGIEVVRVLHGARDIEALFRDGQ